MLKQAGLLLPMVQSVFNSYNVKQALNFPKFLDALNDAQESISLDIGLPTDVTYIEDVDYTGTSGLKPAGAFTVPVGFHARGIKSISPIVNGEILKPLSLVNENFLFELNPNWPHSESGNEAEYICYEPDNPAAPLFPYPFANSQRSYFIKGITLLRQMSSPSDFPFTVDLTGFIVQEFSGSEQILILKTAYLLTFDDRFEIAYQRHKRSYMVDNAPDSVVPIWTVG